MGINNRNLRTFETDIEHTARMARNIPSTTLLVSESGIKSRADVDRVMAGGAKAILVGESLLRTPDVGIAVDELMGRLRRLADRELRSR